MNINSETILKAHSFIAIIKKSSNGKTMTILNKEIKSGRFLYSCTSDDGLYEISFTLNKEKTDPLNEPEYKGSGRLLIGDDAEWHDSLGQSCMANAVYIEFDINKKYLKILSSVVGLPPVFVYQANEAIILSSELYLLSMIPELDLYFDPKGIRDLYSIGHPVSHRTLFRNVTMLEAGYSLETDPDGEIITRRAWSLPNVEPSADWNSFTDLQVTTFKEAMQNIDVSDSFLSLSAGLDTRAIFAELISRKITIPACTMSGKTITLDARIARDLCNSYNMNHNIVVLDDKFYRNLPDYVLEASRLSGGLASLGQAHEVFFYKKISDSSSARLSGNLGNQIGRGGAEAISMRNAGLSVLNDQIVNGKENSADHWYSEAKLTGGFLSYEFLLQTEIPFSSVANYCVGHHFMTQQTPYANARLIEATQKMPKKKRKKKSSSTVQMRLKDLRHRFLGESSSHSFQVKFIKQTGGYVASCPINWGWRAKGGLSIAGLLFGGLSLIDIVASSKLSVSGLPYRILTEMNIAGLHEYTSSQIWMNFFLKDFVYDTFGSNAVKTSGLFNEKILDKLLDEHYSSAPCHHKELLVSLDLALAGQTFRAAL